MSPTPLRAFISYSHKDRVIGAAVKRALVEYGIDGFLAHDDIRVSEEWKARIVEELGRCDVFIPIFSKAFLASTWAQQEVGFICARPGVCIISLSVDGTDPCGFVAHLQGKKIPEAGVTGDLLREPFLRQFPRAILPKLIERVAEAWSFRDAEAVVKPLVPMFKLFNADEVNQFARAAVRNNQVWSAALCRDDYLPTFITMHQKDIEPSLLKALRYQVKKDKPYPGTR